MPRSSSRVARERISPGAQEDLGLVGRHAVGLLGVVLVGRARVGARLARRLLRHAPLAGGRFIEHLYGALTRLAHHYA